MQQASNSGYVPDMAQAAPLDAQEEPEEKEQAPWDDITPGEAGTTTVAAAGIKQPDDIFGPADEFD